MNEQVNESSHSSVVNEEYINNSNIETESVIEDSSINEMEKSFTEEVVYYYQEISQARNYLSL